MKNNIFKSYEFLLLLLLIAFAGIIGLINPAFFSIGTLFDVIRIQTLWILLSFGLLPVLILGGVDISFVAIAAISTFPGASSPMSGPMCIGWMPRRFPTR